MLNKTVDSAVNTKKTAAYSMTSGINNDTERKQTQRYKEEINTLKQALEQVCL